MSKLKPCPCCGSEPKRFTISANPKSFDVIHCPKGCKPHWNSFPVHLRSIDAPEWKDVADAWNTIKAEKDEDGILRVSFDRYPPDYVEFKPEGAWNPWSPEISKQKILERKQ